MTTFDFGKLATWRSMGFLVGVLVVICESNGCASGKSAIALRTLDSREGIVLMRQHESPERLVWVNSALLHLNGRMRLIDEKGRVIPGVLIPDNFSAIRIDPAGRVYVGTGRGPAQECGRVAVVPRNVFERVTRDNPNPLDAMETFWREAPENVGVLHVGTPAK